MKSILSFITIFFLMYSLQAQVGIGTTSPNGALDITSTTDGLLIPRVALTDLITNTVTTPTESEVVFNTTSNGTVEPGYYYLADIAGTLTWVRFGGSGWLLDGNPSVTAANFMGSINDADVAFKRFNADAGKIALTNTSFGVGALVSIVETPATSGRNNVAFGTNALAASINGVENVAIGGNALSGGTSFGANVSWGYANTAVGYNTLTNIRPGNDNVAIGYQAMQNNIANSVGARGNGNIGIGYRAAQNNRASQFIAIGYQAGTGNTAPNNIAIGSNALDAHIRDASQRNIAIGSDAMGGGSNNSTTVSQNVAIGFQAGQSMLSINNVAIGDLSMQQTAGENNTAVGAGTMTQNNSSFNTAIGSGALFNGSGNNNVAIGYQAGGANTNGSDSVIIGYQANASGLANAIAIGFQAAAPASNTIRIGNTNMINSYVQVAWTPTSDRRYKSNIKDSELGLDFLKTLRPVSYFRKNDENRKTEYGFIAQEVEQAFIDVGDINTGVVSVVDEKDRMLGVRYNDFIPMTVKAVQEQQVLIEKLQKENARLQKTNAEILKRLEALERKN